MTAAPAGTNSTRRPRPAQLLAKSGQDDSDLPKCQVSKAKIFCWTTSANQNYIRGILGPHEGRFAIVTLRRAGVVMDASASGVREHAGRKRRSVRPSRVVLTPLCRHQVRGKLTLLTATVTTKRSHRGDHEVRRKTIAQGMSVCSPLTCMLVCANVHSLGTRDRGCSAHPAFPAPSIL
jgi:hypothetical protein